MKSKKWVQVILIVGAVLVLSACTIHLDRNEDGSWRVESQLPEETLQREIQRGIADPQIQELTTELYDGYVSVKGVRQRVGSDQTDVLTFRLALGTQDGHLTAAISDALVNDIPIEPARIDRWNRAIAEGLEETGTKNPNSTLQEVHVSPQGVIMVWRIEPNQKSSSG